MIKKTTVIEDSLKLLGQELPTLDVPVPEFLYIATNNARCPKADIYIHEGDHVNLGQVVGMRHGGFFEQPIHATCSGTFVGYEKHYHRSGKLISFMKFQNDYKDTLDPSIHDRSDEEIKNLTKDQMTEIIKNCASVGLGGSSFPTYIKFQTKNPIKTIIINAVECEPYINADHRAMLESPKHVFEGIDYLEQAFDCHDVRLCIQRKYTDLYDVYSNFLKLRKTDDVKIVRVPNAFATGWENYLVKFCTGQTVEEGKLPMDYGALVQNVSTLLGIRAAIKKNMPVYERRVTVTGDGIVSPSNFRVRVGTPVRYLIEKCGGYKDTDIPKVFVLGGPMMGANLPSDDCIITKTVTSVIVLNEKKYKEEPCIRCGSCILSCPVGLQPVNIMNTMKHMPVDKAKIKSLNPLACIECGLCTYSCTSKIHVTDYVRRAKVIARLK